MGKIAEAGYRSGVITVGVQIQHRCPSCNGAIPLSGLLPRAFCPHCGVVCVYSQLGWRTLLQDVLRHASDMADNEARSATAWTQEGAFSIAYMRSAPRCEGCKQPLDAGRSVAFAQQGFCMCPSCGRKTSVRTRPDGLDPSVLGATTHLLCEDGEQLAATGAASLSAAPEPINAPCSQCGSPLGADGTTRMVACRFCRAANYLPDDLWLRLHPSKAAAWWYLVLPGEAGGAAEAGRSLTWGRVMGMASDAQGRAYLLAYDDDGKTCVFALDRMTLLPRWVARGVKRKAPARIHATMSGEILVTDQSHHGALRFSQEDGRPLGELGGPEPQGTPVAVLDLRKMTSVACDVDGTILCVGNNRMTRFAPGGQGVPTWPGKKPPGAMWRPAPQMILEEHEHFYDAKTGRIANHPSLGGTPWPNELGNQPMEMISGFFKIAVGWDGHLWGTGDDRSFMRWDRAGKRVMRTTLPTDDCDLEEGFGADQRGVAYLASEHGGRRRILCITPDGKVYPFVDDRRAGGPLDPSEQCFCVLPDGHLVTAGDDGILHVIGHDRSVRFASQAARDAGTRTVAGRRGDDDDDDDDDDD